MKSQLLQWWPFDKERIREPLSLDELDLLRSCTGFAQLLAHGKVVSAKSSKKLCIFGHKWQKWILGSLFGFCHAIGNATESWLTAVPHGNSQHWVVLHHMGSEFIMPVFDFMRFRAWQCSINKMFSSSNEHFSFEFGERFQTYKSRNEHLYVWLVFRRVRGCLSAGSAGC